MDKYSLYTYLVENKFENKQFVITLEGKTQKTLGSGENYVYVEDILYSGEEDIYSTYTILWHTENNLYLIYDTLCIEVSIRDIRTYLSENWSKMYTAGDLNSLPFNNAGDFFEHTAVIKQCEYGLKTGIKYYALFHKDSYYVNGKDGPVEKSKLVIWISDSPFINGNPVGRITPCYQDWTY